MTTKTKDVRAQLKAHVKAQAALDKQQITLVKRAHKAEVPMEEIASTLGISMRTAYNRLAGQGPRSGAKWRD